MRMTRADAVSHIVEPTPDDDARRYLDASFRSKGIGGWRSIYLQIISKIQCSTLLEVGAGAPDFLLAAPAQTRIALDVSDRYRKDFEAAGVTFRLCDLDTQPLGELPPIDVAVCSDVFEHLRQPVRALSALAQALGPEGVLLSHVPNEYGLTPMLGVMFGERESTQFHAGAREWDDPHLRRFTDRGYRAFLQQAFAYNIRLTPLRYRRPARWLSRCGVEPPYCLQGGPTYASVNSGAAEQRLRHALHAIGFRGA